MPFKPEFTFPTALPLVKVFFNGLMIAQPDEMGNECDTFVHRTALDHEFSIEIRLKRPNRPDEIKMRHLGPLELLAEPGGKKRGFVLTTDAGKGIFGYMGASTPVVDPMERVFDLNVYHPGKTNIHKPAAEPSIIMNDALFYCAEKTPPGLEVELQNAQTGTAVRPLTEFCAILGANIYATSVNVAWREKGRVQAFPLTNDIPSGAHYEVYIINDPPHVPLPNPGQQPHDELGEYYKILPGVPPHERLKLFFKRIPRQDPAVPVREQDKGSTRIPCMTVIDTSGGS